MLGKLAKSLVNDLDVYLVGFQLGIGRKQIDAFFAHYSRNINMAAFKMLMAWDEIQSDKLEAFKNLRVALRKEQREQDITKILETDPDPPIQE